MPFDPITQFDDNATTNLPDVVDLSGFDTSEEERPQWEEGIYQAVVTNGYVTQSGFAWTTIDKPSKNNDSRNVTLCFQVTRQDGEKMDVAAPNFTNYRVEDLTASRQATAATAKARNEARIKEARAHGEEANKKWDDPDIQRTYLALVGIKRLQELNGGPLEKNSNGTGGFNLSPLVGKSTFVVLRKDKEGKYLEVKRTMQTLPVKATLL